MRCSYKRAAASSLSKLCRYQSRASCDAAASVRARSCSARTTSCSALSRSFISKMIRRSENQQAAKAARAVSQRISRIENRIQRLSSARIRPATAEEVQWRRNPTPQEKPGSPPAVLDVVLATEPPEAVAGLLGAQKSTGEFLPSLPAEPGLSSAARRVPFEALTRTLFPCLMRTRDTVRPGCRIASRCTKSSTPNCRWRAVEKRRRVAPIAAATEPAGSLPAAGSKRRSEQGQLARR